MGAYLTVFSVLGKIPGGNYIYRTPKRKMLFPHVAMWERSVISVCLFVGFHIRNVVMREINSVG
jgi:hypothetical protein